VCMSRVAVVFKISQQLRGGKRVAPCPEWSEFASVCVLNGLGRFSKGLESRVGGCDSLCLERLLVDTHVMKSSNELLSGMFIVSAGRAL
jgi:hypothetical protein